MTRKAYLPLLVLGMSVLLSLALFSAVVLGMLREDSLNAGIAR